MNVNKNAELVSKKEIIINAPVEKVWNLQTDINNWPTWQKTVSFSKLEGDLKTGTTFEWKAMGMNIKSVLQKVIKNKIISWTGDSMGMHAVHIWNFEEKKNKTKIITEESLSGWLPKILKIFMPNFLDKSLEASLKTLKDEAEIDI